MTKHKKLSPRAKLSALALHISQPITWSTPTVGDLYTIARDDLELFEIIEVQQDETPSGSAWGDRYDVKSICHMPDGQMIEHTFEEFMTMPFHQMRVPIYVTGMYHNLLEVYPV